MSKNFNNKNSTKNESSVLANKKEQISTDSEFNSKTEVQEKVETKSESKVDSKNEAITKSEIHDKTDAEITPVNEIESNNNSNSDTKNEVISNKKINIKPVNDKIKVFTGKIQNLTSKVAQNTVLKINKTNNKDSTSKKQKNDNESTKKNEKKKKKEKVEIKENSYKYFFIQYGYFVAIITVFLGILVYSTIIARKVWTNGLKTSVETVLEEFEPNQWIVSSSVPIKNPLSLNAACYDARRRSTGNSYKVVIIRVQTLYGPVPAVFICDSENNVDFVGYSSLHGRIQNNLISNGPDKRIQYWQNKIPYIIGTNTKKEKKY